MLSMCLACVLDLQVYVCGAGIDDAEPLAAAGVSTPQRTFDVVVSNILRGPLLELCPRLTRSG